MPPFIPLPRFMLAGEYSINAGLITRIRLGEYQNIFLSECQLSTLKEDYPGKYEEYINRLATYMASNGRHYANHYATIRKWLDADARGRPIRCN